MLALTRQPSISKIPGLSDGDPTVGSLPNPSGCSSGVEHDVANVVVVGSNPITRSIISGGSPQTPICLFVMDTGLRCDRCGWMICASLRSVRPGSVGRFLASCRVVRARSWVGFERWGAPSDPHLFIRDGYGPPVRLGVGG